MDEKKLKKLNRLELLELLFEVSKENEQLKEELREVKLLLENSSADNKSIDSLLTSVKSLEETVSEIKEYSVKYADAIESGRLKKIIESVAKTENTFETMTSEDTELLANILEFFGQRTFLTCVMPDDLRASLLKRIEESK